MMKSAILACFEDADFEFSLAINTDQQWPQALKGSVREITWSFPCDNIRRKEGKKTNKQKDIYESW